MDSREASKILFKNQALRELREKNKLKYQIADLILGARLKKRMTQAQLAKKIGTEQPSIARVENGDVLPSLNFIQKIAKALDTELMPISFECAIEEKKVNIKPNKETIALVTVWDPSFFGHWARYVYNYKLTNKFSENAIPDVNLGECLGGSNG